MIDTAAGEVWGVLQDLDSYSAWNPFVRSASGLVKEGERIRVRIEPPGGVGMTFRPMLTRVVPGRELRWHGHLFVRGLFDGEHIFEIEPLGENRCRFVQRERFRGVLVPLLWNNVSKTTRRGFEAMNCALKERVEGK